MQQRYQATPPSRTLSPRAPMTSTPTKEPPSARRCLPLNMEHSYGPSSIQETPQKYGQMRRYHSQGLSDEVIYGEKKKNQAHYQSVENAFIARTAVVSLFFIRCAIFSLKYRKMYHKIITVCRNFCIKNIVNDSGTTTVTSIE